MGLGFLTDAKILWVVKNIYLDQNKSCGLMSATQKVCTQRDQRHGYMYVANHYSPRESLEWDWDS
jgi:hypothetical protein